MPDEIPTTTTTASAATTDAPATPPAAGAQPVAFTPEQQEALNRIVQQRLTEDRARRPATPAPVAAPAGRAAAATPAPAATPEPSMSATEVQQLIARDRAFTRVTATAGLTDRQVERMEAALRAENPADVSAWSREYLTDMKLGQPATATTTPPATATQTATTAPVAPTAPPAAAPSAPSAHALPTANGLPDLFNMTPAQHQTLGPEGIKETLQRLWSIGNQASGAPARPKPPSQR